MPDNPKNLDHISRFLREHGKERMAVELETELEKFTVKPMLASEAPVYELLAQDVLRRVRANLLAPFSPQTRSSCNLDAMSMLELSEYVAGLAKLHLVDPR